MNQDFFRTTAQNIEGPLLGTLPTIIAQSLTAMAPAVHWSLILFVLIIGYMTMSGRYSGGWFMDKLVTAGIIVTAYNAAQYNQYIYNLFVTALPNFFARAVTHGVATTLPQQMDLSSSILSHINSILIQNTSMPSDIDVRIWAQAYSFFGNLFLLGLLLIYEISRIYVGLVLAIGPFIIVLALFQSLRPVVDGWISKLISLTVLALLVSIMGAILVQAEHDFALRIFNEINTTAPDIILTLLSRMVLFFGAMTFLAAGLPSIAYSIGRGVATNTNAPFQAMSSAVRAVTRRRW